jgi:transcription antitermination protein NusB
MSSRRIARELAVIVLPQLPKDKNKLAKADFNALVIKAVRLLVEYAKSCLADVNAFVVKAQENLVDIEIDHEDNAKQAMSLKSVPVNTGQLKEILDLLDRAMHLVSEALDIPEVSLYGGGFKQDNNCPQCGHKDENFVARQSATETLEFLHTLVSAYMDHKEEIDNFINRAKAKWRLERMVSIDRDILRLACAEALYVHDVPINVAISEGIELSHRFADQTAAKFVNGILADLAAEAESFRQTGKFSDGNAPAESSENVENVL